MTNDVKFCKDCKFYKLNFIDRLLGWDRHGQCSRSSYEDVSQIDYMITGRRGKVRYYYASTMRSYDCGTEAKWYEPKV